MQGRPAAARTGPLVGFLQDLYQTSRIFINIGQIYWIFITAKGPSGQRKLHV
jgi:hypothetical protein